MNIDNVISFLDEKEIAYLTNQKTADFVSIKIGGVADLIVFPSSVAALCSLLGYLQENKEKFFILGNGTNTYFSDEKYEGVVIVTTHINKIKVFENKIIAQCGASLEECCNVALNNSLTGLEFAYGIPGSVGGAVYMNASAFECSVSNIVNKSTVYSLSKNEIQVLELTEHEFDIKKSVFNNGDLIVLESVFNLSYGDEEQIKAKMQQNRNKRLMSQPLSFPSAGSTFKRPKDGYASVLIDKAGLKGYKVGGAEVSTKHAGFIINTNNATSCELQALIEYVKERVYQSFGVLLNEEIIFVK